METFWNVIGYGSFVMIILGVLFAKVRKPFLFIGPLALAFYAWLFLHNPLLIALQILITFSGFSQLVNLPKRVASTILVLGTLGALAFLFTGGYLVGPAVWVGTAGFLCVAFGIVGLPRPEWFAVMAIGGVGLVLYAWSIGSWVYVFLNGFFAVANFFTWIKAVPSCRKEMSQ